MTVNIKVPVSAYPKQKEGWYDCNMSRVWKPLYILTGCSGIGKTTTAKEVQKRTGDFVVLDADMLYNIMPHDTEKDYFAQVEQMESLTKNIMQCGKTVIWTMTGNLDKLPHTYHCRFFSGICVLALVCSEELFRRLRRISFLQIFPMGILPGGITVKRAL